MIILNFEINYYVKSLGNLIQALICPLHYLMVTSHIHEIIPIDSIFFGEVDLIAGARTIGRGPIELSSMMFQEDNE